MAQSAGVVLDKSAAFVSEWMAVVWPQQQANDGSDEIATLSRAWHMVSGVIHGEVNRRPSSIKRGSVT